MRRRTAAPNCRIRIIIPFDRSIGLHFFVINSRQPRQEENLCFKPTVNQPFHTHQQWPFARHYAPSTQKSPRAVLSNPSQVHELEGWMHSPQRPPIRRRSSGQYQAWRTRAVLSIDIIWNQDTWTRRSTHSPQIFWCCLCKKAISYFMADGSAQWNTQAQTGSPTMSKVVNKFIQEIKKHEVCKQGKSQMPRATWSNPSSRKPWSS